MQKFDTQVLVHIEHITQTKGLKTDLDTMPLDTLTFDVTILNSTDKSITSVKLKCLNRQRFTLDLL